jgi:hypothetical protein
MHIKQYCPAQTEMRTSWQMRRMHTPSWRRGKNCPTAKTETFTVQFSEEVMVSASLVTIVFIVGGYQCNATREVHWV